MVSRDKRGTTNVTQWVTLTPGDSAETKEAREDNAIAVASELIDELKGAGNGAGGRR